MSTVLDFLLLLEQNRLVPTYVVQVAYSNGREGEIFDGEICALQHSHGGTGLVSVPDVWWRIQCSGNSNGAQGYPDASERSNRGVSSYLKRHSALSSKICKENVTIICWPFPHQAVRNVFLSLCGDRFSRTVWPWKSSALEILLRNH